MENQAVQQRIHVETSIEFEIFTDSSISEENLSSLAELLSMSYLEFSESVSRGYMKDLVNVRSRIGPGKEQIVMRDSSKQIIGCVCLYDHSPDQHAKNFPKNTAYLRFLAIHPSLRGQGLGKRLVQFCLIRAKTQGNEFLVRKRFGDNWPPSSIESDLLPPQALHSPLYMESARKLYDSMGFSRHRGADFVNSMDFPVFAFIHPLREA